MKIDSFLDKEKSPDKATTTECNTTSDMPTPQLNISEDFLVQTTLNSSIDFTPDQQLRNLLEKSDLVDSKNLQISKTNQNGSLIPTKINKKLGETERAASKKRKLFLCSECNQHFNLKSHLFRHFFDIHKKFTCLFCCGLFLDAHSLEKHLVKKHGVQKNVFYDEKSIRYFLATNMPVDSVNKVLSMICCECGALLDLEKSIENHPCTHVTTSKSNVYQRGSLEEVNNSVENFGFVTSEPEPVIPQTDSCHVEANSESLTKLVPKITLRIPRAFQSIAKSIESDEDSGDEMSDSDDGSKEHDSFAKSNDSSFSDHENDEKNQTSFLPSLKLKIKNLGSNPESYLENLPELMESQHQSVEHEIEDNNEETKPEKSTEVLDMSEEKFDEPKEEEELEDDSQIMIDGVKLIPAGDDVLTIKISMNENLIDMPIIGLLKMLLRSSFKYCLYCNHARKIVVNGRALALHFITSHRFNIIFLNDGDSSEITLEMFVTKIQNHVKELDNTFFNMDTYDNTNHEMIEGHVTISHDKLYECFQCRFQTPIHKELYLHNRKMHQKSLINCLMCKTPFYSYSELLCHICPGIAHKQTYMDFKFYCCLCNLNEIPSAFRLMIHLRKKHFACDVCLEKCSDQAKLSSHVWKHKLFHLCYRCNICYRSKADIMKHLFWKHGTEGIECRKCLQKKWPHVYHFCTPPSEFKCNQCEKVFTKAVSLKVHMRLHEQDGAKYECSELECDKKFIAKKLLIRHLERHKIEKMTEEEQKEIFKSTIIVPAEIPEGCCTRSLPVIFNRQSTRALQKKVVVQEVPKVEEPVEESPPPSVESVKKSIDIPKSELNLSESSDSDSGSSSDSDTEKKAKEKTSIESLAARLEAELDGDNVELSNEVKEQTSSEIKPVESDTKTGDQQDWEEAIKEVATNVQIVNPEIKEKVKIHVCQSDHDYATLCYTGNHKNIDEYVKKVVPVLKNSSENPFAEFSSSSSSDSSDTSSNSSSSSSSGSGTSTDTMSSSEASTAQQNDKNKKRNKKFTKKRQKKTKQEIEVPEEPKDPDLIIYDSDLLTNESDTDEDFYDEHPLKLDSDLSEKRKLLSKCDTFDGIVENSRPSTPSLPEEERVTKKQKKKRRKEHKKNTKLSEFPQLKSKEANQIRNLLENHQFAPSMSNDFISVSQVPSKASSATSSRMNSDSENPPNIKRSQRKRIPNKFYGYTSGDESLLVQPNDPFRPIPPPQLTWRKEDLPEKSKSQTIVPKVAPLKLNLTNDHLQQQLHSFALEHGSRYHPTEPETMMASKSAHASSKVKSNISFDFKRSKSLAEEVSTSAPRKIDHEKSMYAFHTLETPPAVEVNPPLKFKLKINSRVNTLKRKYTTTPKSAKSKVQKLDRSTPATVVKRSFNEPKLMGQHNGKIKSRSFDTAEKKQKLEEAIQNTQQYFQRFNFQSTHVTSDFPTNSNDDRVYCYCRRAYDDLQGMIGCDGHNCQIEWFHFECVGILVAPKGNWFCPECMKEQAESSAHS